jgi:hypothetical protein
MESETYRGYVLWEHVIREQPGVFERERYAASGTVTKGGKFVEASGILEVVDSEPDAEQLGLEWARAQVDNHI